MKKLILLLSFIPFLGFSQEKINDTIDYDIAILKDDTTVSKSYNYTCDDYYPYLIDKNEPVFIEDAFSCSNRNKKILKIRYYNKSYFIDPEQLILDKDPYEKIRKFNDIELKSYNLKAIKMDSALTNYNLLKYHNYLLNASKYGILITKKSVFDQSEYTSGTGYEIEVYNPSKKTIKYIWVKILGFNPVNDVVFDKIKNKKEMSLKLVGPINPDEFSFFSFDYVWMTDLVESSKITGIKIQYMDGTFKEILKTNNVFLPHELIKIRERLKDM